LRVGLGDRLHLEHEVVVELADVLVAHLGVGGIGHGRIEPVAVLGDAAADGIVEFGEGVIADAAGFVRGDIGGVDDADRAAHGQAPRKRRLSGQGMAGHTIGEAGNIAGFPDREGGGGGHHFAIERARRCAVEPQGEAGENHQAHNDNYGDDAQDLHGYPPWP
jgi:hypothetical protein